MEEAKKKRSLSMTRCQKTQDPRLKTQKKEYIIIGELEKHEENYKDHEKR